MSSISTSSSDDDFPFTSTDVSDLLSRFEIPAAALYKPGCHYVSVPNVLLVDPENPKLAVVVVAEGAPYLSFRVWEQFDFGKLVQPSKVEKASIAKIASFGDGSYLAVHVDCKSVFCDEKTGKGYIVFQTDTNSLGSGVTVRLFDFGKPSYDQDDFHYTAQKIRDVFTTLGSTLTKSSNGQFSFAIPGPSKPSSQPKLPEALSPKSDDDAQFTQRQNFHRNKEGALNTISHLLPSAELVASMIAPLD